MRNNLVKAITRLVAGAPLLGAVAVHGNGRNMTQTREPGMTGSSFRVARGVVVPDLTGIREGYSTRQRGGYVVFVVNVSADRIGRVFLELASIVDPPGFFVLETPTHFDEEKKLRPTTKEPFHEDVHYLDGISVARMKDIFQRFGSVLVNDGLASFGFGSHKGRDEVFIGAYKIFYIYADRPDKYRDALGCLGFSEVSELRTVRENFTPKTPGQLNVLADASPNIWGVVQTLKGEGLHFAERREAK